MFIEEQRERFYDGTRRRSLWRNKKKEFMKEQKEGVYEGTRRRSS